MSLQLFNKSIMYLVGILEDVPIRIDQLYLPTNFVIMEIKKDSKNLIILGRLVITTIGAITNVKQGKLAFEVGTRRLNLNWPKLFLKNFG